MFYTVYIFCSDCTNTVIDNVIILLMLFVTMLLLLLFQMVNDIIKKTLISKRVWSFCIDS